MVIATTVLVSWLSMSMVNPTTVLVSWLSKSIVNATVLVTPSEQATTVLATQMTLESTVLVIVLVTRLQMQGVQVRAPDVSHISLTSPLDEKMAVPSVRDDIPQQHCHLSPRTTHHHLEQEEAVVAARQRQQVLWQLHVDAESVVVVEQVLDEQPQLESSPRSAWLAPAQEHLGEYQQGIGY
jgi:hypothetical protein